MRSISILVSANGKKRVKRTMVLLLIFEYLYLYFFFHIFLSLHKEICISFALSLHGLAKSPSVSSPLGHEVNQPGKLHLLYATLVTFFNSKTDPMTYTALVFSLFEMKNSTYIIKCVLYSNQAVTY